MKIDINNDLQEQSAQQPGFNSDELRERLDDQLLVDPVVEPDHVQTVDWSVRVAARFYKKSPRQIQRLLKSEALKGYKINGPKGPEWRVLRNQTAPLLAGAMTNSSAATLTSRLDEMENRLNNFAQDFQSVKEMISHLETDFCRIEVTSKTSERLHSEITALKQQLARNQSDIKDLGTLWERLLVVESLANEVRSARQAIKDLEDRQAKSPWWKK